MGKGVGVLEKVVPFDFELSVICARTHTGQTSCFPPARNAHHVDGILDVSTVPAGLRPQTEAAALDIAVGIAHKFELVGLIAVEMFAVGDDLVVNELAPPPPQQRPLHLRRLRHQPIRTTAPRRLRPAPGQPRPHVRRREHGQPPRRRLATRHRPQLARRLNGIRT